MKRIGLYGKIFQDDAVSVIRTAMRSQCELERLDPELLTGDLSGKYRMIWVASFDGLQKRNEAALLDYVACGGAVLLLCDSGQRSALQDIFTGAEIKGVRAKRRKTIFTIRHPVTTGIPHWTTNIRICLAERNPLVRVEALMQDMSSGLIAYARRYALGRIVCCLWIAEPEMLEDMKLLNFLQRCGQWLQGKI